MELQCCNGQHKKSLCLEIHSVVNANAHQITVTVRQKSKQGLIEDRTKPVDKDKMTAH